MSPIRTAASSGIGPAVRKKGTKNLQISTADSESLTGVPHTPSLPLKGTRKGSPRGTVGRVSDATLIQFQAQIARRWMIAFLAYTVCLTLLVGVAIERSDRQWRAVNIRLDALLARSADEQHVASARSDHRQLSGSLDLKDVQVAAASEDVLY